MTGLQAQIEAVGREIFERIAGDTPRIFSRRNLTARLMGWAMRDEQLKVQLFRFVDVLPTLKSSSAIVRHASEYLGDGPAEGLPRWVRWGIRRARWFPGLAAFAARQSVSQLAHTFILAPSAADAIPKLRAMRQWPIAFTADILGETAVSESEAESYQARYLELIDTLADEAQRWPIVEQIDCDDRGPIPKANVSVKISALYSQIRATDPEGALARLADRMRPLLRRAMQRGVFLNFDMEQRALKDLTFELFKRLLDEAEFRDYAHAGIALQAYLREAERDLVSLIAWARARGRRITVRLVKGAYWDYETIVAHQRGWPVPVFERKAETDANFERLARRMLEAPDTIRPAFGTHSVRSIAACLAQAGQLGLPKSSFEFQMLYGMAEPIKRALIAMGCRVRDYCPIGEVLPGMGYLVRRLLENTANEGFLRATFAEHISPQELLRDPLDVVALDHAIEQPASEPTPPAATADAEVLPAFANAPPTDFTIADSRRRMQSALAEVRRELGRDYPLIIGNDEIWTAEKIVSTNPARPTEVIGRAAKAGRAEADLALAAAQRAFEAWSRRPASERSQLLERAADIMEGERLRLAALEVYETGKIWTEADADVAEAIDFCRFYAEEMRRLAIRRYVVPGETSVHHYIPRGIAVVIAPWNFPLAILCGMTVAAAVTGNCVLMKPSAQSVVVGAWFMDVLRRAGFPPGVIHFVPGSGAEVGDYLVNHPNIDLIAFTGSREVGLQIYEAAGRTRRGQAQLKKVICEMGGKNALIVDDDADLDEAIPAIVSSAFGYQGQKCSALSRLIVLRDSYDAVLRRLIEATRSLTIGPPEDPATAIGPVIDEEAHQRILSYIELGQREARLAFRADVPVREGYFIGPTIFADVPHGARIEQEEIFGPVLCVLRASSLAEAIAWANDVPYALTGGFFSRSPSNIERVKESFLAGNLYINRGITGALVARHPFGGFKMSGGGTKAGGRDYLLHFLFPRVVTENLIRRGFAPRDSERRSTALDSDRRGGGG